ncbi:MAG: hypothetical protein IJ977_05035 [Fibrobacter sp.]|nr:hypothetical protein [Fibrobacter sp.]
MKRFFALLLVALMVFSLFACGNTEEKQAEAAPKLYRKASYRRRKYRFLCSFKWV